MSDEVSVLDDLNDVRLILGTLYDEDSYTTICGSSLTTCSNAFTSIATYLPTYHAV
jgi:hypothetical protein